MMNKICFHDDAFSGFLDAQIRKDDIEVNDDVGGDETYEVMAPHQLNQLEVTYILTFYFG